LFETDKLYDHTDSYVHNNSVVISHYQKEIVKKY